MDEDKKRILELVDRLSPSELRSLREQLFDAIDQLSVDTDEAWEAELTRRMDELKTGKVKGVSWPDALRMILEPIDPDAEI